MRVYIDNEIYIDIDITRPDQIDKMIENLIIDYANDQRLLDNIDKNQTEIIEKLKTRMTQTKQKIESLNRLKKDLGSEESEMGE